MARLFKNQPFAPSEAVSTIRKLVDSHLHEVERLLAEAPPPVGCPFILYDDHTFPGLANAFLRSRYSGNGNGSIFDIRPITDSSLWDYARDLVSFLNLYSDPDESELTDTVFSHYFDYLSKTLSKELSSSTIDRREYVARSFRDFIAKSRGEAARRITTGHRGRVKKIVNFANSRVATNKEKLPQVGRRRSPNLLHLLPPDELRRFFSSFKDRTLRATAMSIYSTGGRRMDICQLTAGAVAKLRPAYPGGPAFLKVRSKGGKERPLEIESDLVKGLKAYNVSPHRLKRAALYASRHGGSPLDDQTPLFINRDGDPLTRDAVTDAFRRASARSGIFRTPHELRHEFAVSYLLNAYRGIERTVSRSGFDRWLGQLLDNNQNIIVVRLAKLLGHADVEFTKRKYLVMLADANPAIRDAWCEHLSSINLGSL